MFTNSSESFGILSFFKMLISSFLSTVSHNSSAQRIILLACIPELFGITPFLMHLAWSRHVLEVHMMFYLCHYIFYHIALSSPPFSLLRVGFFFVFFFCFFFFFVAGGDLLDVVPTAIVMRV